MGDSVDVKRHVYLRTIAKQKVYSDFNLATFTDVSSITSTLVSGVGIPPSKS